MKDKVAFGVKRVRVRVYVKVRVNINDILFPHM